MADKLELAKEKYDHSGLFDFSAYYSFAHAWLSEEKDYGVVEDLYSEKVSGNEREIAIKWTASKKVSDYFKVELKFKFLIFKLVDVEVEMDGEKKKMNKGKFVGEVKANLIRDPSSNWDVSPFNRFLRGLYDKFVIPQRIDGMEQFVLEEAREFVDESKAFLELTGKRKAS
jgi:hypothetical protein